MIARDDVHQLLDELPDDILPEVARYLAALRDDPLARLLLTAPIDDEPETDEERAAVREAREEAARVGYVADEDLDRELGW
ncbi:MAG TPA: hypothetical protein VK066_31645 [Chloroflexota bacterium]|nr:hypothetical protein [Chloroflexota bacterium]